MAFHRTLMLIEFIGDRPATGDPLDEIAAATDGDLSMRILMESSEEVLPAHAAQILIAQGSGADFLGLADDGRELNPDHPVGHDGTGSGDDEIATTEHVQALSADERRDFRGRKP